MPSNKISINDSEDLVYDVPDSFMPPLISYLEMVRRKTGIDGEIENGQVKE